MDLDFSDVFDSDVCDSFVVTRRVQTMKLGRTVLNSFDLEDVFGTVTAAGRNDIQRLPEGISFSSGISIVTPTRLYPAGVFGIDEYHPDLIKWNDCTYVVVHVDNYHHAGSGFWQVLAEATTSQEVVDVRDE